MFRGTFMLIGGFLLNTWSEASIDVRVKRLINGQIVNKNDSGYASVSYYVLLGDHRSCSGSDTGSCNMKPDYIRCGGSLLTPTIVQTACHCLSAFEGQIEGQFTKATIQNHWETLHFVMPGELSLKALKNGIRSKRTYVHGKCKQLRINPYWVMHDYGILVMESSTREGIFRNNKKITYAPVYSSSDLVRLWEDTMWRGSVCLGVGFGLFKYAERFVREKVASENLRWGVGVLVDYWRCYHLTVSYWGMKPDAFDYKAEATFACTLELPTRPEHMTKGDSGGPICCSNFYFALFSMYAGIFEGQDKNRTMQTVHPISYTIYENSIEYRRSFMESVVDPHQLKFEPALPRPPTLMPTKEPDSSSFRLRVEVTILNLSLLYVIINLLT